MDRFVAIEPEAGEYFLGDTFDGAMKSARTKYPFRLSHPIRIGHRAAFHIGGTQVVAIDGQYPQLGTMLLGGHRLVIG